MNTGHGTIFGFTWYEKRDFLKIKLLKHIHLSLALELKLNYLRNMNPIAYDYVAFCFLGLQKYGLVTALSPMLMTLHTSMAVSPLMAVMLVGEACRYEGELEVGRTARLFCNYDPQVWKRLTWRFCWLCG